MNAYTFFIISRARKSSLSFFSKNRSRHDHIICYLINLSLSRTVKYFPSFSFNFSFDDNFGKATEKNKRSASTKKNFMNMNF